MLFKKKPVRHEGPPRTAPDLSLYYFPQCPYCVRVLKAMDRLHIELDLRNTREHPACRQELIEGGGRSMVPCLRMEQDDGSVRWMYESLDIVDYLQQRFASPTKEQTHV